MLFLFGYSFDPVGFKQKIIHNLTEMAKRQLAFVKLIYKLLYSAAILRKGGYGDRFIPAKAFDAIHRSRLVYYHFNRLDNSIMC